MVLLGTTSLYGIGSSQYNRLSFPADEVGGAPGLAVKYEELGHTAGYGSFYFSDKTVEEIEVLLARTQEGRRVNSIFGEGVNPRLRKIRNGLDAVGIPSEPVLKHGNRRIVYGIPLATNFREVLLGKRDEPEYILPQDDPERQTQEIADYWIRRWLARRVEKKHVLEDVEQHTFVSPIRHGARVRLPKDDEGLPLFGG